jgi:hypothetical protein
MVKPILSEKLFFFLVICISSYAFSFFLFDLIYQIITSIIFFICFFTIYSETKIFDFIQNYLYIHKISYHSRLVEGKYHSLETPNRKHALFYKKQYHSEKYPAFNDEYYLFGYKLDSLKKVDFIHSDITKYVLSSKNYINENNFFNLMIDKNYEKVEQYIKDCTIKLVQEHYLIAIDLKNDNYINIFNKYNEKNNINVLKNIEELLSYSIAIKNLTFARYFLSLINNDFCYISSKTTSNIISILIIHENLKEISHFLKCAKNVSYSKDEASSIFNYAFENLKDKSIIFNYSNIVDNLNYQTLARYDIEKLKTQYKISKIAKNF